VKKAAFSEFSHLSPPIPLCVLGKVKQPVFPPFPLPTFRWEWNGKGENKQNGTTKENP